MSESFDVIRQRFNKMFHFVANKDYEIENPNQWCLTKSQSTHYFVT